MTSNSDPQVPGPLLGRSAVQAAWRAALLAVDSTQRQVTLVDRDFAHWPLGEPAVLDHLGQWLRLPGRQLRLLALDFASTERALPRLARWRRDVVHALQCATPVDDAGLAWPSVLMTGTTAVQLLDPLHWRARLHHGAAEMQALAHEIDALAQRCEPAWPVTHLGL
ncbi:MAG: hypothetical protein CFE45_06255 [Burkholderiales bacterium PBB5]|nr:MAG: hypothetical protein CFE45_06255 [Burkholderiales bacterium PBB5]